MTEPREHSELGRSPEEGEERPELVRLEEEVTRVAPRWRGAGHVHIRKQIDRERVREDHSRDVEDVELRRVAVAEGDSGQVETLPDGSISIPVFEEELIVTKRRVLKERVIVEKRTITERQRIRTELRKERVTVGADEGIQLEGAVQRTEPARLPYRAFATETRPFFLTSEFLVVLALLAGIAIAGATGALNAAELWILVAVLVIGFVISRGLAKAGTAWHRQSPHDEEGTK